MPYYLTSIMPKHSSSILALARRGAEARWNELQAELASLRRAFPDLGGGRRTVTTTKARRAGRSKTTSGETIDTHTRRRQKMSPAARRAVSLRMKKYWAARRKAKSA
jgi:hypothetical protein